MSWTLMTLATPVDPATLAPDVAWTWDTITDELNRGSGSDEMLSAGTRNGYLTGALQPLIAREDSRVLSFLVSLPWDAPDPTVATLLRQPGMAQVVLAVDRVFDAIATDPATVLASGVECCCATHLQEHAAQATASLHPMIDEGENLESVFNFLRSLQALCRRSQQDGRYVLAVQMW